MSEHESDLPRAPHSEVELEAQLARYGPLMGQQQEAEAEMDRVFAARLRAHLLDSEELSPHPTFARNLRSRLLRRPGARPVQQPAKIGWRGSMGISALATAALLVFMLIRFLHGSHTQRSSFAAPYPQRADLVFSFPSLPAVIHRVTPTLSLVHPSSGIPYAGHLRLAAPGLPHEASTLPAFRLAIPTDAVARGRRLFQISSPVERATTDGITWLVAQDGGEFRHRPLHSLAVSTRTGELIYHDRRNHMLPLARHPANRTRAIAIARAWLTRLGWPGQIMPLRFIGRVAAMKDVRAVVLSWPHVGSTATDAATLWITPNGSVIEAWVWPPILRRGVVPASPIANAWKDVRRGTLPLAVEGVSPSKGAGGIGTLQRTGIVSILTSGNNGTLYLVPTYRFSGTAQIVGAGRHIWYSLAPSMAR